MQRIHLIAPAGTLHPFFNHLGVENGSQMMALFQEYVGRHVVLSANLELLDAHEDELRGGRLDDEARVRDISSALGNEGISTMLAVRGGAWFTRLLARIDFSALDRRTTPITVIGFSELSPLINVVANHPMGRGYHDMGPAFLTYGLKRHASQVLGLNEETKPTAEQWMREHLRKHLRDYFLDTVNLLEDPSHAPSVLATLVRGNPPGTSAASIVGGNLTVLSTMIGSRFASAISPDNRWLMLEDFNDKPERLDRFLAHFTLAGYWDRCAGLLLGDFHRGDTDLLPGVLAILNYHLRDSQVPVLTTCQLGHIWPMTPLPLNKAGHWDCVSQNQFRWTPSESR